MLDALHLRVRLARRVVSVPVLVVLGVDETGRKRLVALRVAVSEAATNWGSPVDDLIDRRLPSPALILSDGHKGLRRAIAAWPEAQVQRCTQHKRENLKNACPAHARPEMLRDYAGIVNASSGTQAREFRRRTKTEGSFPTEDAAVTLLYGLVAVGQIRLRKVDGPSERRQDRGPGCREVA
jgi:transposase-like protein